MKSKETIILFAIVVILGAFIYFVERKVTTTEERSRRADKIFRDFHRDKITKLEVFSEKGKVVVVKELSKTKEKKGEWEEGSLWRIETPYNTPADSSSVDGVLSEIEFLDEVRRIEGENAKNLSKFGLDKPSVKIKFWYGNKMVEMLFGKEAPGEGIYLRTNSRPDAIFVVRKSSIESFTKEPADFRDRQLVSALSENLTSLKIFEGERIRSEFSKKDDKWNLQCPEFGNTQVRASKKEVKKIINELTSLRAQKFLADNPQDSKLSEFGIGKDSINVMMKDNKGKETSLKFGNKCGGETKGSEGVAVFVEETKTLACSSADITKLLTKSYSDFRLLTPAEFDEFEVASFEVKKGKESKFKIKKEDEKWLLMTPTTKEEVDGDSVTGLLNFMRNEKATSMIENQSELLSLLKEPEQQSYEIVFYDDTDKILENVFLARTNTSSFLFKRGNETSWGKIEGTSNTPDYWELFTYYKKNLVEEDYYNAKMFSAEGYNPPFYHKLIKDEEKSQWIFESPKGITPDSADTRETIETLASLTAQRFVDVKANLSNPRYGLVNPAWKIRATFSGEEKDKKDSEKGNENKEKERKYELIIGNKTDNGFFAYIEGGKKDAIFTLSEMMQKRLTRKLCDRSIFQVDFSSLDTVKIEKGKLMEEFRKEGDLFTHISGTGGLVDTKKLAEFIHKLETLRIDEAIAYGTSLPSSGLNTPSLKITIKLKKDETTGETSSKTFIFGTKKMVEGKEKIFAMAENQQCVYMIDYDTVSQIGI